MITNLSLTLEDNAESAVKVIVVQQKSLGSVTKEVLDDRTALDYLSLSKEVSVGDQQRLQHLD